MLTISRSQYETLEHTAEARYRLRLAQALRRELGEYLEDLSEAELSSFVRVMVGEARSLGFVTEDDIAAFARPCVVYGAYCHRDPLFEPIFYAALPGRVARRPLSAAGISAATAQVLSAEFAKRSGTRLIVDLAAVFLVGDHPPPGPRTALETYFPERAERLPAGALEAHLALAAREADRLRLHDADARRVHRDVAQLLGACFAQDPLYPWAIAAFSGADDDRRRISRLRAALKVIAARAQARS
jgi:predicted house-cleaning noncanonical NTP pyrophosphatase (MazG superfamily)